MSDLFTTRKKVEEGAEWRGSININIDDEQQQLCVRQLRDPEFWEVMSQIDIDELESLGGDLPEDELEEFQELRDKDSLTDAEEQRLEALQNDLENQEGTLFDNISTETFEGVRLAAKYGAEPDNEDKRDAIRDFAQEIENDYGQVTDETAEQWVNDNIIHPMMDASTDFTSFSIGVKVLTETLEKKGNLEN